jgi:hypothetical protein
VGGYIQTFASATTWTVTHNLNNLYPSVTTWDNSGVMVLPKLITVTNANSLVITFNVAVAGTANVISGTLAQQAILTTNPASIALSTVLGG